MSASGQSAGSRLNKRLLDSYSLRDLQRLRWWVGLVMLAGVAASIAANVLHANPHWISRTIAAWPAVAFLATVEVVSRVPVHRPLLAAGRILSTIVITVIAGWISYGHMRGVAELYGETGWAAVLLPLSVDGLIVVASLSLVELAGAIKVHKAALSPVPVARGSALSPVPAEVRPTQAIPVAADGAAVPVPGAAGSSVGSGVLVEGVRPQLAATAALVDADVVVAGNGHEQATAAGPASANGHDADPGGRTTPARQRHSGAEVKARVARKSTAGTRYQKASDEQRLAKLRELARDSLDGKVGVREAARELRIGTDAAYRLLQMDGLARDNDPD